MTILRPERPSDAAEIAALTTRAFATAPHSGGNEAQIIAALRDARALTLSLVLESPQGLIGHAAWSPVQIADGTQGWYGLGPVSVAPEAQGLGHGGRLIHAGMAQLAQDHAAAGCVVLGDPAYYSRFGFAVVPGITFPNVPAEYFMAQPLQGSLPRGEVTYHKAFYA
ncbi:N-acetyltransferase [Xinfangfangia sp. CPCC 101601]|uniref:N-acetyltransferase n=1 Tax=Pseudogemmobacter lacusdianii TaxID=3069608 RepID=A0ABU0VT08_9RHOB|nr:N-acetyltransferase [Xinfangfangia sp. CPCC 101601]MDQ2064856.1 N-acetyltransferase [Xinfangfangia sp. CPCC 101601]